MKRRSTLAMLAVFVAVGAVLGAMEFNTLTGPDVGSTASYHAVFGGTDGVSGLRTGDSVRAAGVAVGTVTATKLVDASHVEVTFTANGNQALSANTWAVVRYANLLGQRYLALTQSAPGGAPLRAGGTIPQARTRPALSLTALFNGFRPLFAGLSPQQVNDLSNEIVAVLQGQGGNIDDLIAKTADLTRNLADRDQTFTSIVGSLSSLLTTIAAHDDALADTVTSLRQLTGSLQADGPGILSSLGSVNSLTASVAGLLDKLDGHGLSSDIADLNAYTATLAAHTGSLDKLISGFVTAFGDFARITQNGNWANIYPCQVWARTFGTPSLTAADAVAAITDLLGPTLGRLLAALGLGTQSLAALALPIPIAFPTGRAGSSTRQTAVCR